jgi:hypothetical protein
MQLNRRSNRWGRVVLFTVICVACGDTKRNNDATNQNETGAWPPIPEECVGLATAFTGQDCAEVLHQTCRSKTTEEECLGQGKALVGSYEMSCHWTQVVTFEDDDSCTVASVSYRCDAWMDPAQLLLYCPDPCEAEGDLSSSWRTIQSERELLKICGGPFGPWAGPEDDDWDGYIGVCVDNVSPPAPALCDCTAAACAATE